MDFWPVITIFLKILKRLILKSWVIGARYIFSYIFSIAGYKVIKDQCNRPTSTMKKRLYLS